MKRVIGRFKKESKSMLSDLGLKQKPESVIGLDLGTGYFRAVRVKGQIKEIPLKDILIKELSLLKDLPAQMNIVSDEWVSVNFKGKELAVRRAIIPFMPLGEVSEALKWELGEGLQADIDNAKIKFNILREKEADDGSKKIELIAIVYNEADIEAKVRKLKAMGLNIQSVIPSEFALASYVNHLNLVSPGETAAIVNIGSIATTITVLEDRRVSFVRYVTIGGDTITEAMTGILLSDKGRIAFSREEAEKIKCEQGITEDISIMSMMRPVLEKLVTQIKRSMEYYEHRFGCEPIKKIILAGNGAALKGLREYISKEMDIEVPDTLPETAEAVGLALSSNSNINMLPERFKEEKGKALKRISMRMVSILLGFVFLFSYGFLSVKAVNLRNEVEIYREHLQAVGDIGSIKDEMAVLGSAVNNVSSGNIKAGNIMKELSNIVPPSVMLNNLIIKDTEPNLKLSGIIFKEGKLSEFMSNIENSPLFEKVKLVFSEKDEDYSRVVLDFEIACNLE